MSATEIFTLERAQDSYIIISTGGAGAPGAAGPEGPSATPGETITDPFIDTSGHVAFTITTQWGLDADDQPYFEADPNNIPIQDRAYFDWTTLQLTRGGPGLHPPTLPDHYIGEWAAFTTYGVNNLISHGGQLYRVTTAFQSGASFSLSNLEVLSGNTGPVGTLFLDDDSATDVTAYSGETGQFIQWDTSLTRNHAVTLSPWRDSFSTTHGAAGWFVVARSAGATGPFVVTVVDGQGGTTLATLTTPLSWALCAWDSTAWQFVIGSTTAGGTSAVTSVNGHVGDVQLQPADIIGVAALTDVTAAVATETSRAVAAEGALYTKPGGGIPSGDLDASTRTALALANSALQSAPVTSVNTREGNVTGLAEASDLATTNTNVATNTSAIATNTSNIATNTSAIAGNTTAIGLKATDTAVVHLAATETITGDKNFTGALTKAGTAVVAATRQVISGTGLTGGGDLSADRTLAVAYGSTSTTAAVGNDSRLSDARTPTAHASSHATAGSDALTLAESQITNLSTDLSTLTANQWMRYMKPTGAIRETFPRMGPVITTMSTSWLTTGKASAVAIILGAGDVITSITFRSSSTAVNGPTHQWFGLADSAGNVLRFTSDDLTTAWGASATKTLTLTSTYTVPTTGLYYLFIQVTATTSVPNLSGSTGSGLFGLGNEPVWQDTTHTSLTTTASAPGTFTFAAPPSAGMPYAYVS